MPKRKWLIVGSSSGGPWTNVGAVKRVRVVGGSNTDRFNLLARDEFGGVVSVAAQVTGPGIHEVDIVAKEVKVERVSGNNLVTIVAEG